MADYDSILKEEKKYEETVIVKDGGPEPFPWFKTNVILLSIVLVISYIAYYYLILTPDKIFLNDVSFLYQKYLSLLEPISPYTLDDNYNLKGKLTLNDSNYNILINKNDDLNFNLVHNNKFLDYYSMANKNYLKISNFNDNYYQIYNNDYYTIAKNLKSYFSKGISKNKFIKKVYVNNTVPIVESNLVLNNDDILQALGVENLENTYQVLLTFKNNALTNSVISMKVIINNLTTRKRVVLQYQNNYLTYRDSKSNLKFELEGTKDDFNIKIYQDDTIYGVLRGIKENSDYQYLYQSIEHVYTINLNINFNNDILTYTLASNIEKDEVTSEQTITMIFEPNPDEEISKPNIDVAINYNSLNENEKNKFKNSLEVIIGELRDFIEEHQQ